MLTLKKAVASRKKAKAAPAAKKKAAPAARKKPASAKEGRFLVLLRHGIAEDPSPDKKDEDRGLTAEGHARMKEIAKGLRRAFPKAQIICTSPLLRAVQTALWVSKGYQSRATINTTDALAPGASAKQFRAMIDALEELRVVVVGHEPDLSRTLSALTGIDDKNLELKKGGAYGVRLLPDGTGRLEWFLSPKLLRKLG
jgi:phosphohistidine phosphatase